MGLLDCARFTQFVNSSTTAYTQFVTMTPRYAHQYFVNQTQDQISDFIKIIHIHDKMLIRKFDNLKNLVIRRNFVRTDNSLVVLLCQVNTCMNS